MKRNATFTTRRYECRTCGAKIKRLDWDYDAPPPCSCEGAPEMTPEDPWENGEKANGVISDEIDITMDHVMPGRRFTSKSEMHREMAARGYANIVTHIPTRGSDKNPHTTRWI